MADKKAPRQIINDGLIVVQGPKTTPTPPPKKWFIISSSIKCCNLLFNFQCSFCAIIISEEVITLKKDIDFDKIAKETLYELTKNFKTEGTFKEIGFKIAEISTKTVKLMLKKYHQELLED